MDQILGSRPIEAMVYQILEGEAFWGYLEVIVVKMTV